METLQEYFEKQCAEKGEIKFNIFSALHNMNDEERLHSRFIAYLLRSDANHRMGNEFLKLFVQSVLQIDDFDCENYTIETEYKGIDILIYNDKQAIIIENKIYAGDSNDLNRKDDDKYKWQLARYYHTIMDGKDKDDNNCLKRNVIKVIYLTLDGRAPKETRGDVPPKKIQSISYNSNEDKERTDNIKNWLNKCIEITDNEILATTLSQYIDLITQLTSDVNQAKENQIMISENIDKAWELEQEKDKFFTEKCKDIFKHVKWHTVADFINELEIALQNIGAEIIEKPDLDAITKVTHNNRRRKNLVIRFVLNEVVLQIVNDGDNGFTLGKIDGNPEMWRWDYFSNEIKSIRFYDFSAKQTFCLINDEKRGEIIEKMVVEVLKRYDTLENQF